MTEMDQLIEELNFLKKWKTDVMDVFIRYDAETAEELERNILRKGTDNVQIGEQSV